MPHRTDITNATARTTALNLLQQVGRFNAMAAPIVMQRAEQLRSLGANMAASVPPNGDAIRAALAVDQEDFTAAVIAQSPNIEAILDFVRDVLTPLKAELDAMAANVNVTTNMPLMVVDPADIEP